MCNTMRHRERGQGSLELALWALAALGILAGGVLSVRYVTGRDGNATLSPAQQEYVRTVATQQAVAYIAAIATQQAASPVEPLPASVPQVASSPVRAQPPPAPEAPPNPGSAAAPTDKPTPTPAAQQAAATPDNAAALAACQAKVQHEQDRMNEFADQYRRGVPPGLSGMNKELREVTPGVINECAAILTSAGDTQTLDNLCAMYNSDPAMLQYKPQACPS
jgi:hypothetical protein